MLQTSNTMAPLVFLAALTKTTNNKKETMQIEKQTLPGNVTPNCSNLLAIVSATKLP